MYVYMYVLKYIYSLWLYFNGPAAEVRSFNGPAAEVRSYAAFTGLAAAIRSHFRTYPVAVVCSHLARHFTV
jgi:hypothetical protein